MFADMFKLRPAPVVGARLVRPLLPGLNPVSAKDLGQKQIELARFLAQIEAVRDRRTHAREHGDADGYTRENREYKRIEYHVRALRQQINKLEEKGQ